MWLQERNQRLNSRTEQLDKQINLLIEDSVGLLKTRMTELGINSGIYTKDLLGKAKEIIFRHRELQAKALKLQSKVSSCDGNVYVGGKFDELVSIWVDEELIGGNGPDGAF